MPADPLIRINHQIRDLLHRRNWYDPDSFGLRLAEAIPKYLRQGMPLNEAVRAGVEDVNTSFFRANRGAKSAFSAELETALRSAGIRETTTLETILAFKAYAERQLVTDLKSNPTEAPARAFLQTYLEQQGRTYREVAAGGGRTDILVLGGTGWEVVETKVWRGQAYHEDGLIELSRYVAAEGLQKGFSVVFEFFETDPVTLQQETRQAEDRMIEVVFVHVPLTPPSKVGSARRKRR